MDTRSIYTKISERTLDWFLKDIDTLKNKYTALDIDVPRSMVLRLKKSELIDGLAEYEFGKNVYKQYKQQCEEWDDAEIEARAFLKDL